MEKIKIKFNGKEVEVDSGKTILDVAKELGVHIPTLCHFESLIPSGFCRICLVEDRGALKASCVTPVANGMEIQTDTPLVKQARYMNLQLLFGERNHYCMYCESSGDCELQNLGYEFGLDHFDFPPYERKFPVDNSHEFITIDHNRCVLCRRCVRGCSELAGHFVLGEKWRGTKTMIIADFDVPLGESTCTSCGLCVQICPTGAITDKRAAYLGRGVQSDIIPSTCDACPVGCGINVYRRSGTNFIIKIYGDWNAPINEGVLCKLGRYSVLYDERKRLSTSKIRDDFGYHKIDFDGVLKVAKSKIGENAVAYVDGSLYNEELSLIKEVFGKNVYSVNPVEPPIPSSTDLSGLSKAEGYVVIGVDLNRDYGVVGSMIKRKVLGEERAKLFVVDDKFNSLTNATGNVFAFKDIEKALEQAKGLKDVVVVYSSLPDDVKDVLLKHDEFKYLWLPYETNTIGLIKNGIKHETVNAKNVFFFGKDCKKIREKFPDAFIAAATPFEIEATENVDLIIATKDGFEREGTFYNLEGKSLERNKALESENDVIDLVDLLSELSGKKKSEVI